MACVAEAKRSFWALVNQWKAKKSATLTLKSVNGDLTVAFSVNLGQHNEKEPTKTCPPLKRGASSSKQRRKQKRAADPAVQLRAEAHAAAQAAAGEAEEEADIDTLRNEEAHLESSLAPSPEKEAIREELFESVVEKPPFLEVPHDFEDRANNDYEHDFEKTKEAEKILSEDRCCFCNYECPPPTPQENGERFLGILQQCWDHIEESHPLAYEWLS